MTQHHAAGVPASTQVESGPGFTGRAVVAARRGGPGVLQVTAHHIDPPGPDEIVIEMQAAGVAFGDLALREGLVPGAQLPAIPGFDAAGIIQAAGAGVSDLHPGDHVVVRTGGRGGYATHIKVPRSQAVPYPGHLDPAAVTSLMLNYLTALQMLTRAAHPADDAIILVHSAAGGVGSALLELGALRGMRMFGTAGAAKASFVRQLGATPIDYRTEDFARRLREEAPDGIDAIFDALGPPSWRKDLPLLRPGGQLVVYGVSTGFKNGRRNLPGLVRAFLLAPRTSYLRYFRAGTGVTGYSSDAIIDAHPDWFTEDVARLIRLLDEGAITPRIHRAYPLADAAEAHRELGSGRVTGKIVLTP